MGSSSGIGAGIASAEEKYEPSTEESKVLSSRERFLDGFVDIGVMPSLGVHDVEWLAYEIGDGSS
jgi:hypothetical protein